MCYIPTNPWPISRANNRKQKQSQKKNEFSFIKANFLFLPRRRFVIGNEIIYRYEIAVWMGATGICVT